MRCLLFLSLFGMANKEKPKGQRHGRCPLGLTLLAIPKRERKGRQRIMNRSNLCGQHKKAPM